MKRWIALAMLAAGSTASAQVPDALCEEVRLFVAAAGESPPFASLAARAPETLPKLGFNRGCRIDATPRPRLRCHEYLMDDDAAGVVAGRVLRCLPAAVRISEDSGAGAYTAETISYPYYHTRLRAGRVVIEVARHGNPGHHLGQVTDLEMSVAR